MLLHLSQLFVDQLLPLRPFTVPEKPIQVTPEHHGSALWQQFKTGKAVDFCLTQKRDDPVVPVVHNIKIPFGCIKFFSPTTHNGKASALGEGGRFQSQSEFSEIVRCSLPVSAGPAVLHGMDEFICSHPMAIINNGHNGFLRIGDAVNVYFLCIG